jgi:hypothetical protein
VLTSLYFFLKILRSRFRFHRNPRKLQLTASTAMTKLARYLLVAMSAAFGLCVLGLVAGMVYYLSAVYFRHRTFESVMGNIIPFNKALGGIGILGMILFFAFLFALMSNNHSEKPR